MISLPLKGQVICSDMDDSSILAYQKSVAGHAFRA